MKKIIKIILLIMSTLGYSQDNIVPIEERHSHDPFEQPKVYYKDINGVFDKFIGTWKWQNTTNNPSKIFEITFSKVEMRDQGGISFKDYLTSMFKYTNNGVEVYNTYNDRFGYILGSWIVPNSSYTTNNGLVINHTKMELTYSEPIIDNSSLRKNPSGKLIIEYQNVNGEERLIWNVECFFNQNGSIPFRIPITMTLIKQ